MRSTTAAALLAATMFAAIVLVGCGKVDQNLDKTVWFDGFTIQVDSGWELKGQLDYGIIPEKEYERYEPLVERTLDSVSVK